ncbi:MAG TPA: AbrB family transcriptional regulator [Candidatus Magasanikbacteria bacterium]|nr:AbrB family transcriptional regulator [Candidatus Magasanikbacteria bacterium]
MEMSKTVTLTTNKTVKIPAAILKKLNLVIGTKFDVDVTSSGIVLSPLVEVPRSQAYFWTRGWQEAEKEAEHDIKAGRVKKFKNMKALIKGLST